LLQLRSNPDAILPNPVETAPTDNRSFRSRNSVVFSGTLTAKKGIISLVKAWPRVVESCRRAELHVYGKDGRTATGQSMQAYLLSQANGVSTSMRFHGHVTRDKLFEALRAARVAVFPSYAEACAIAPLESMMHGCMTISSRRGSGPEFIEDGRSGLLVDPDRPDEIADAIIRGLTDDELACRLAEAGKALVRERFSLQTLLPENEAFYQRCIAAFAARTGAR
jgi:glycosyltransferase involved in cell wall biosynthesis